MKNKMLTVFSLTVFALPLLVSSAHAAGSNSREAAPARCVLYYGCPPVVVTLPAPVVDTSPVPGKGKH
jgi:hypothetical protein